MNTGDQHYQTGDPRPETPEDARARSATDTGVRPPEERTLIGKILRVLERLAGGATSRGGSGPGMGPTG